jgi:hypothetical protein
MKLQEILVNFLQKNVLSSFLSILALTFSRLNLWKYYQVLPPFLCDSPFYIGFLRCFLFGFYLVSTFFSFQHDIIPKTTKTLYFDASLWNYALIKPFSGDLKQIKNFLIGRFCTSIPIHFSDQWYGRKWPYGLGYGVLPPLPHQREQLLWRSKIENTFTTIIIHSRAEEIISGEELIWWSMPRSWSPRSLQHHHYPCIKREWERERFMHICND